MTESEDNMKAAAAVDYESNGHVPPALDNDASPREIIQAINGLASELQLTRLVVANMATSQAELAGLIRKAILLKK